ncbi:hypothetical protein LguiA_007399 [Lonicera macranthoides]
MCRLWLFHSTAISIIHVLETYLKHKIMYDDHDYASFLQIALIGFFLMTLFCSWLEASAIYKRGNTEIIEESFKISEKMFDQAVQIVCPGGVIFVFYINLRYPFWVWSTAFSSLITYTFSESATSGLLGPKKRHNALTSHRIAPPLFALAESNQNPFSTKACSLELPANRLTHERQGTKHDKKRGSPPTASSAGSVELSTSKANKKITKTVMKSWMPTNRLTRESIIEQNYEQEQKVLAGSATTPLGFAQLASKMVLPGRHDKNRGGQVVEDVLTSSLPTKLMRIFVYGV